MIIEIFKGDITKMNVEAVVNAANTSLMGGGGVDGAIHRAGGQAILEDCIKIRNRQGGCKTGEAVITTAGLMNAEFVIHTVGPVWNQGNSDEKQKLKNCYLNSLELAEKNKLKSVAFPNISTGVYRFPKPIAAKIALEAVQGFNFESVEKVVFVCFDVENYTLYEQLLS